MAAVSSVVPSPFAPYSLTLRKMVQFFPLGMAGLMPLWLMFSYQNWLAAAQFWTMDRANRSREGRMVDGFTVSGPRWKSRKGVESGCPVLKGVWYTYTTSPHPPPGRGSPDSC